jgi:hypothetical protein
LSEIVNRLLERAITAVPKEERQPCQALTVVTLARRRVSAWLRLDFYFISDPLEKNRAIANSPD